MAMSSGSVSLEDLMAQRGWLRRLAVVLVGDGDAAEDLVQETLIVASSQAPDEGRPLRPWLGGIVRNRWRMFARTDGRRSRRELASAAPDEAASAETLLAVAQMQRLVVEELEQLPEIYRSAVLLRFFGGLEGPEIARRLNVPHGTVRRRLKEGLDQLRARLDARHGGDRETWKRAFAPLLLLGPVDPKAPTATGGAPHPWTVWVSTAALVTGAVVTVGVVVKQRHARLSSGAASTEGSFVDGRTQPGSSSSAQVADRGPSRHQAGSPATTAAGPGAEVTYHPCAANLPPEHPRLLVERQGLCALHTALRTAEGARGRFLQALAERVASDAPTTPAELSERALASALMYLVTGDRAYASGTYDHVRRLYGGPATPDRSHPINSARWGAHLALAFDWAYPGFTAEQRDEVQARLRSARERWETLQTPKLERETASHWLAYVRSAELLQILALGAEPQLTARVTQTKTDLASYLNSAPLTRGVGRGEWPRVTQSAGVLLPAIQALASVGDDTLERLIRARPFASFALFEAVHAGVRPLRSGKPDVDLAHVAAELALLFSGADGGGRSAYRGWFDQVMQPDRAAVVKSWPTMALVWATLLYPDQVVAARPRSDLLLTDERDGAYLFQSGPVARSIAASVLGGFRNGTHAERVNPVSLGIRAFGVTLAGAPGKRSGLLVDGRADEQARAWPVSFTRTARGGVSVMDALPLYASKDLTRARRHVLVDGGPTVLVSTLDEVRAGSTHLLQWQINPDVTVVSEPKERDQDRRAFVLRRDRTFLKGWVLNPPDARVNVKGRVVVKTRAAEADLWVVMLVGEGAVPEATFRGEGLDTVVTFAGDGRELRFDRASERLIVGP